MLKYGLLGHPLGHSFSRKFHNERFATMGVDAEYVNFDLDDIQLLPTILAEEPLLSGLNVTIPYKQQVMAFLDDLDPVAQRIGAVNTVRFIRTSDDFVGKAGLRGLRLVGHNTDIIGFRDSIQPLLLQAGILPGTSLESAPRALILGTGGASKAIRVALEDMGIIPVFVSRRPELGQLTYAELTREIIAQHLVIVNCSPVGMHPQVDACPDIPYEFITPRHVCYDLIYNPAETLFLAKAKVQGARTMSGGAMLEGQAIASYEIWTRK